MSVCCKSVNKRKLFSLLVFLCLTLKWDTFSLTLKYITTQMTMTQLLTLCTFCVFCLTRWIHRKRTILKTNFNPFYLHPVRFYLCTFAARRHPFQRGDSPVQWERTDEPRPGLQHDLHHQAAPGHHRHIRNTWGRVTQPEWTKGSDQGFMKRS